MRASTLKAKASGMEYSMHSVDSNEAPYHFSGVVRFDTLASARIENRFPGRFDEIRDAIVALGEDATDGWTRPVNGFLATVSGTGRAGSNEVFEFVAVYLKVVVLHDGAGYVTLR